VDTAGRAATNSVSIFPLPTVTAAAWSALYPFTNNFNDANGYYNGNSKNGACIQNDPARENVLNLTGVAHQYVNLPPGAGAAETFSGWVKWSGGSSWQRIFDFGLDANQFFYLTPSDGNNLPQVAITPNLSIYNQTLESPTAIPASQWTHVAVVMNGREGMLYLNGQAVAVNNSVNLLPSDIGATNCNFGKSQFSSDPYFNGRLSDVNLNSTALPLSQIIAPSAAITQPAPGAVFAGGQTINFAGTGSDYSGSSLSSNSFTWSVEFHSNDVTLAVFGPLTGVTSNTFYVPTNGPVSTNVFYRILLTITDTNGYQQTAFFNLPPQVSVVNFDTIPSGLQLTLDGSLLNTPSNMTLVAGYTRAVSAPTPQNLSGTNYNFVLWSDGGSGSHSISVSTNTSPLVASYVLPRLKIETATSNILASWPTWAAPMSLYSATNLNPPINWLLVTNYASISNSMATIQLPLTGQNTFFRLELRP
jgi:hypothetical protein